ncbi:hypothetical protein RND71_008706 [Anisodus tanguticus]|uniref:Uncharacterized protein n=1 Tax=Anisodus tanguticus TaxID=243964 RepID=A0AAE1SQ39_9SOLA|nr:hypothetical protein RND71_008706 [Anisodus tanguticus]
MSNGRVDGAKVTPKFVKRSHSSAGGSAVSEVGSTSNYTKVLRKRRENTSLILQQIIDLERLQLTEGSNNLTSGESKNNVSSLKNGASWDMHNKFDRLQRSLDLGPELQDWGSTHESPVAESFPLSLPDGDSFWECKSPVQSNQELKVEVADDFCLKNLTT